MLATEISSDFLFFISYKQKVTIYETKEKYKINQAKTPFGQSDVNKIFMV